MEVVRCTPMLRGGALLPAPVRRARRQPARALASEEGTGIVPAGPSSLAAPARDGNFLLDRGVKSQRSVDTYTGAVSVTIKVCASAVL